MNATGRGLGPRHLPAPRRAPGRRGGFRPFRAFSGKSRRELARHKRPGQRSSLFGAIRIRPLRRVRACRAARSASCAAARRSEPGGAVAGEGVRTRRRRARMSSTAAWAGASRGRRAAHRPATADVERVVERMASEDLDLVEVAFKERNAQHQATGAVRLEKGSHAERREPDMLQVGPAAFPTRSRRRGPMRPF